MPLAPPTQCSLPRKVHVEEVEDPDTMRAPTYTQAFPGPAGIAMATGITRFQDLKQSQEANDQDSFYPFANLHEWELAETLMTSGMSLQKIDKLLKLPIGCVQMREHTQTSYSDKRTLLEKIDVLPSSGPSFKCTSVKLTGDLKDAQGNFLFEELELFHQDPVECVRELISNLAFREMLHYAPEHHFEDEQHSEQIYNEMWTADWWWNLQQTLPPGITISPVILASDKTRLSQFSGDKCAWPVYITIGNIPKSTHCKPSLRSSILLGYIPVSKLTCFSKPLRSVMGQRLFHHCMRQILEPMITAGAHDGGIRDVFPILSAYVADFPEQALIACCRENWCPQCMCYPEDRGDPLDTIFADDIESLLHDPGGHIHHVRTHITDPIELEKVGMHAILQPFWEGLPHCNIFQCFTPDILHQLHKGVFKDHLVAWCMSLATKPEVDARFQAQPTHPSLRHFKKGISTISQWSGTEYKNMEKVFVGLISGAVPPEALEAARAVLDFIYLAQYASHSTTTLQRLQESLARFHAHKDAFITHNVREHFQIPKIHAIEHYFASIKSRGTADEFNTELPERLHIDFAKIGYRASSRRDYIIQMTKWITRQEKIHAFTAYLQWRVGAGDIDEGHGEEEPIDMIGESTAQPNPLHSEAREEEINVGRTYHVAKHAGFPNTSVPTIIEQFGAVHFLPALAAFLKRINPQGASSLNEHMRFDLYKRVRFSLRSIQQIGDTALTDIVRATPIVPRRGRIAQTPAHFDTVLVHYTADAKDTGAQGYRVARVRAIFRLPDHLHYPHPLAYIEWYSEFREPVPGVQMYRVSTGKRRGNIDTAVIRLDSIRRSCHLIPVAGAKIDRTLAAEDALDRCTHFYVSDFLDLYTYQFFND
ncbi:hypothetical protein K439DRAFT_1648365 [Ramaria rubella]|nr:hypothetical protein K439DRAFT_1648365 [Ramaria rubella]